MVGLHRETVANRKANAGEGFGWYRWECIGTDAIKLTGCVSSGVVTKGPRKGRPRYDGKPVVVVVTEAEAAAERARYEAETGKCGECFGTGKVLKRWHHIEGSTYRPCGVCHGSGLFGSAVDAVEAGR